MEAMVEKIFILLNDTSSLLSTMQASGLALLAILIPFAIAILTDILNRKKDSEKEFTNLDLHVALDHIFKVKYLFVYLGLIFLPSALWHAVPIPLRLFGVLMWAVGIYLLGKRVLALNKWTKGNVWSFRHTYLENLSDRRDLTVVWRSVWETRDIESTDEKRLFEIFSSKINDFFKTAQDNDLDTITKCLNDFNHFIERRELFALAAREDVLPNILKWHANSWSKQQVLQSNRVGREERLAYYQIFLLLNSIIEKIEELILKSSGSALYSFFDHLKQHFEKHKDDREYISDLFSIFFRIFTAHITDAPQKFDIWEHYFPAEWKITKDNLLDKENHVSKIALKKFLQWAMRRLMEYGEEYDSVVDDVSTNLFPEVDPTDWSKILLFALTPHDPENRMDYFISGPWKLRSMPRVKVSSSSAEREEEIEREQKNTFELVDILANMVSPSVFVQFSEEPLRNHIIELENLKYEDSTKEKKRRGILDLFKRILEYRWGQVLNHDSRDSKG